MIRSFSPIVGVLLLAACFDRPSPVAPESGSSLGTPPEGRSAEVTPSTPAALGPRSTDRVVLDARTALQRATTLGDALGSWGASLDSVSHVRVHLAADVDGRGTNALRFDWQGTGEGCTERSPSIGMTIPKPYPDRIYIQWKQRLGRSRTGGGLGQIDSFVIPTGSCEELDGRFVWTVARGGDSPRRVDLRWRGRDKTRPVLNVKRTSVLAEPDQGWDFLPGAHVGEDLLQTLYVQAESKPGAADGVLRLWIGDRLLVQREGLALGADSFRRMNFPWTMAAPSRSQTEYYWDMVSWVSAVAAVTMDGIPQMPLATGGTATLRAHVVDGHGADISGHVPLEWESSDETVVRVSAHGELLAMGAGDAVITLRADGQSAQATVHVVRSGFYVAPTGTAEGDGSWSNPWALATALSGGGGRVIAGDTIWLRGGVYQGDFTSTLTGAPGRPVVLRQLPGERATIEGQLWVNGAEALYWGFEIRQADALATNHPTLVALGSDTRYVNLVIHDAGENGISFHTGFGVNEVYGCIVYNNGNERHFDQGIYASNDAGEKFITDNVFFTNMASGIQVFATRSGHSQLVNVRVVGNISFNNSYIASDLAADRDEENLTAGADLVTSGVLVTDNLLYYGPGGNGQNMRIGLEALPDGSRINRDVVVRDNYVVGGATVFRMENWQTAVVQGNTLIGDAPPISTRMMRMSGPTDGYAWSRNVFHADPSARWRYDATTTTVPSVWRDLTGLGAFDEIIPTLPTQTRVFVRPNNYERGRAHIAVVNWGGEGTVSVELHGILHKGDRYLVRNVQDLWGTPVASGTYDGSPIVLPMNGVTPPAAVGRPGTPPRTGPFFDTFLLTLEESARTP
jgi:hypothetical protein